MSRNPLRRFADQLTLTAMRPSAAAQLMLHRPLGTPIHLPGKRVLVTGASSGIGESAAEQFGSAGAAVVAVARRKDRLDAVVRRIADAGGSAHAIECDLSDLAAIDRMVEEVDELLGGVDILVNNAGRSIRRPLAESLERWHDVERTIALNYYAPLRLVRGFGPGMRERGDGHVINVATWGVYSEASPMFAVYNASKTALSAVSRALDTEWSRFGVRSTTLYYPLVNTPMIAPTASFQNSPALTADEAADWMITAARYRPVRIAPRIALAIRTLDTVNAGLTGALLKRHYVPPGDR